MIILRNLPLVGVASSNASIGNYHGLKKIHMPLTFQQDKGISFVHMKRLMTRNYFGKLKSYQTCVFNNHALTIFRQPDFDSA